MLSKQNNKKSLPGLKYAFIHCLLSNLTDNEIENNLLNTFYNKFLELDALNAKVKINRTGITRSDASSNSLSNVSIDSDSENSLPVTPRKTNPQTSRALPITPKKPTFPLSPNNKRGSLMLPRDFAYSAVTRALKIKFNLDDTQGSSTLEVSKQKTKKVKSIVSTQEILDQLNAILELKTEIKSKTAKIKLLNLIQYLLELLKTKETLPDELMQCINDFFYRLDTASEQILQLAQFKDHKTALNFSCEKALTENKGTAATVEQEVKKNQKQIFSDINTAFYIGGLIDNLYLLKERCSEDTDKETIDSLIEKLLPKESEEKNYHEIFYTEIETLTKNIKKTINKEISTILIGHFIQLQSYVKETDWRYFKYLWLSEFLKKNTIDNALTACQTFEALVNYAITIINKFRQKKPKTDFDKQSIRIANAVFRFALTDNSISQNKKDEILALNPDQDAVHKDMGIEQRYASWHHKSSPYYLYSNASDSSTRHSHGSGNDVNSHPRGNDVSALSTPSQINYIKEVASEKLTSYIEDRKNSIFYLPYDLVNRGNLGIDNKTTRLEKASKAKEAIEQINSFNSFAEVINNFASTITQIHDHTSWLKAELRSLSYRMFTVLDKAAAYNNDAKQAKYAILTKILNPCIAEIFGSTNENAYPTQRKILRITDSFSGFITKLKFKLANMFDSSQYREESIQEFQYIYNIHFQLQQLAGLDHEKDGFEAEITEAYTNLFELLAHAANNIHNADLTDKINSTRNVLLRMFRPLHNPKISTLRLPFTDAQRQRIKDSLDNNRQNSYDSKKLQSMLVNSEANLSEFKEALAVKLHSHFLAKVVLSTGEVARTRNSVDIVADGIVATATATCLAASAPHAVYGVNALAGLGMSGYNQDMKEESAKFAENTADETHRKILVNLIVDKVVYRYHHQIANLVHPIDIKKLAGYFAERILFQSQNAKSLDTAANNYVDNIMKFPKIHGIFLDENVVSQHSSSLEISKLCTKPNVAIHVSGFSGDEASVDKIQFYGRVTNKLKYAEKYGYVYETSEFQLKILEKNEPLSAECPNTYFLKKTENSYELFYLDERIQLFDVKGLKEILAKQPFTTKEILECLADYHGKKSVKNLNVSENTMQEVKLSKNSQKTEKQIKEGKTKVGQLQAVRFFHHKRTERNHQEQIGATVLQP